MHARIGATYTVWVGARRANRAARRDAKQGERHRVHGAVSTWYATAAGDGGCDAQKLLVVTVHAGSVHKVQSGPTNISPALVSPTSR